jgi:hypothetical protein
LLIFSKYYVKILEMRKKFTNQGHGIMPCT